MEKLSAFEYALVFVVTLGLAMFLTPLALRVALRRRILDHPSEIKGQSSPVPYLGGLAIVVSFAAVILLAAAIRPPVSGLDQLAIILGIGIVLAVMGLADDLRGLGPAVRLSVEIAAGIVVWATPAGAEVFESNELLNFFVTVLWVVGMTNALNFLDNMDGLSGGVSSIAAFFVFVIALDNGQFLVAILGLALAGCALGFLRSNFHPARIYMGDAGALFLGFTLAVLTLKLEPTDAPPITALFVPVIVLAVPLFDTSLVTINRLIHGRSPLLGGRDHMSHRLVFAGLPVRVAVSLNYVIAVSVGVLALVISRVDEVTGLVLLGWIGALAALGGVTLSLVPVYDTSTRRHLRLQEVLPHEHEPPAAPGTDRTAAS